MNTPPPDSVEDNKFVVNLIHIGQDTIQLLDVDGKTKYFPMTESCQQDQTDQADAFAEAIKEAALLELDKALPEKPKKDDIAKIMTTHYEGDNMARAYRLAIDQVKALIQERLKHE